MPQTTLDTILAVTRARIAALRPRTRELERRAAAAPEPRSFSAVLRGTSIGVIAEVKRRSPSAGAINENLDPVALAGDYAEGGAVAISVLTDEAHFGGSLDDLEQVARQVPCPVLRKDFILDEIQLLEARAAGASAILLIVRAMAPARLNELTRAARDLGLGVLVEAHNAGEIDTAVAVGPTAVGVNSRDLATFKVDHGVAEHLIARVPYDIPAVAESGIESRADVERFAAAGADLVLVGTAVARATDPAAAVRGLSNVTRRGRHH
jgi:indole-3-glycerol phosphate synthase